MARGRTRGGGRSARVKRRRPRGVSDGDYCAAPSAASQEGYFEKSTLGACAAPGVSSSKYGRGPLPRIFAVNTCGKRRDRKSTRLNSSHGYISYAVFCLKK